MTNPVNNPNSTDVGRTANGRFTSGNPGRPAGAVNARANGVLSDLRDMTPDAVEVVRTAIANGEIKTACWLIERVLPKNRTVALPGSDVSSIIEALTDGSISPDEASLVASALARLKEIDEMDAVKERLQQIEALLRGDSK